MAKKKLTEIVTEIVVPIIEENSYELVDVEFVKEGTNWFLRIYIDKPTGITLDDCQIVSEKLSEEMDKIDPIKQSYFMEVSSPGIDRPLKKERDFEKVIGELVEVKLYKPLNGSKVFEGLLNGYENNKFSIQDEDGEIIEFKMDEVVAVKRVIKF